MEYLFLRKRITHKYRDGWSGLDRWKNVGWVKLLGGKVVSSGNGFDEGPVIINHVAAPAYLRNVDLTSAIHSTLGGTRCQHEHDCCGCALSHVRVKRTGPRRYSVRTSISYNY